MRKRRNINVLGTFLIGTGILFTTAAVLSCDPLTQEEIEQPVVPGGMTQTEFTKDVETRLLAAIRQVDDLDKKINDRREYFIKEKPFQWAIPYNAVTNVGNEQKNLRAGFMNQGIRYVSEGTGFVNMGAGWGMGQSGKVWDVLGDIRRHVAKNIGEQQRGEERLSFNARFIAFRDANYVRSRQNTGHETPATAAANLQKLHTLFDAADALSEQKLPRNNLDQAITMLENWVRGHITAEDVMGQEVGNALVDQLKDLADFAGMADVHRELGYDMTKVRTGNQLHAAGQRRLGSFVGTNTGTTQTRTEVQEANGIKL